MFGLVFGKDIASMIDIRSRISKCACRKYDYPNPARTGMKSGLSDLVCMEIIS